jgi:enediyne biosynthesis protein E4
MKNILLKICFFSLIFFLLLSSCKTKPKTLFRSLPSNETGVDFINLVKESDSFNILTYEYIYNGGGVGIADFNQDGLQDLFFSGNQVPNRIYLNKGNLTFEDITEMANVNVVGRWNSGVALVDINNDDKMDIYVCVTAMPNAADRKNMLFVNQGNNENGRPVFKEMASQYKIDDEGYSVMASFFDYDLDGDLDLYVLTNEKLNGVPTNYRPKIVDGSSPNTDRLYKNNGDGTFTNASKEAGVTIEGFGLGLSVSDFNSDGWPDLYISNDYLSNDILYINNRDGTFKNKISEFIGHQSLFSMGNDAADINNDAKPEIITLDMLPEINLRKKTTISNKSYQNYINNEKFGYEYQYVRNMLQMNNSLEDGIKFSEVGQMAGIYQTEWSWSPLFADFDNDGLKDLLITNGFPKDITDKDFSNYRAEVGRIASNTQLIDSIPIIKLSNFAYKNTGNLSFEDVTKKWGFDNPSFSNGAAFSDLDNDGDLDYVVNNINDIAFIYENTLSNNKKENTSATNFLRIDLEGAAKNKNGIGSKITLKYNGEEQFHENFTSRGFLSSVEPIIHFGMGDHKEIDTLIVQWPDRKQQMLLHVNSNQVLKVNYSNAQVVQDSPVKKSQPVFVTERKLIPPYKHIENDVIDFNIQRTLPHKFSQSGPSIAVGDVNNDDLEDFVIGGAAGYPTTVFIQIGDEKFTQSNIQLPNEAKIEEDEGLLLFDADDDLDLDLYIVSGSIEPASTIDLFQDRLYLNDGKGNFKIDKTALPDLRTSGSCVRAADYDKDGDLDLFVGGRVNAGKYPLPATNYLLQNDQGKFTDITDRVSPTLKLIGMVTDALWTDFNSDGSIDLMVAGEFMAIHFFKNTGKGLSLLTKSGLENHKGWWNSITSGDFDEDGDTDYIVSNLGQNNNYGVDTEHPLKVFAKDFDGNGSVDPVLACYMKETASSSERKLYPVHFWDELNSQSPKFRNKFSHYREYGKTTIENLFTPQELKDALILEANYLLTSYVENMGGDQFKIKALDRLVQVAPVNGMITGHFNKDNFLDVAMIGNDYGNEVFAGRYDAFTGIVLLGNGKGEFQTINSATSGFYVPGDGKALVKVTKKDRDLYIATQNRDSLKAFCKVDKENTSIFKPYPFDVFADILYTNGKKQRVEFYYGSGYLSQSTRQWRIPKDVAEITVYDSKGKSRKIKYEAVQ